VKIEERQTLPQWKKLCNLPTELQIVATLDLHHEREVSASDSEDVIPELPNF
jgi:hypothetical protein